MNEKTEELRDIFTSVTDEETITESQEDTRGSLTDQDESTVDERLEELIGQLRERYAFDLGLEEEVLLAIPKAFYEEKTDADIADELGIQSETVFEVRMALHLVDENEADGVDLAAIRDSTDDSALAEAYDTDEATIRRYRQIAHARDESRAANDRYRDEFDSILAESELSTRMATNVREDGLEDATEGMETDVSF